MSEELTLNPTNWLGNWMRDRAIENRVEDVRNPGEYNASTWDRVVAGGLGWLTGGNIDVDKTVDRQTQINTNKAIDDLLYQSGKTREQLGLGPNATKNEAAAAISNYNENYVSPVQQAQIDDTKATQTRLLEGQKQNYELSLQQMINNNESAAATLRYQMLRDRKEDRMYNERMDKLDRKDRIAALQNVAGGLAALGAAFAI
tara:strand:- start:784 stop:1389 length:606 start_codon:yes stop_codon:yes gene_type:complete